MPLQGHVAKKFAREFEVDELEFLNIDWPTDQDLCVKLLRILSREYEVVMGIFPPQAVEAMRRAYYLFCQEAWEKSWPSFYSPVFGENGFERFAVIA
jgi:hypothetical protein